MVDENASRPFATLQRLARKASAATQEQCELCSEPIGREHRHLLEVSTRQVACVCRACSILFNRDEASNGKYKLIPDRRLVLPNFELSDVQWESLRIPVGIAYFVRSSPPADGGALTGQMTAFYPSPAGQTESFLNRTTWHEVERCNPLLASMRPDVEALLVNRARGMRQYFLVPVEDCYSLVGLVRLNWRGLSGGQEVWKEIARFFETLAQRSKVAGGKDAPIAAPLGTAGAAHEKGQST